MSQFSPDVLSLRDKVIKIMRKGLEPAHHKVSGIVTELVTDRAGRVASALVQVDNGPTIKVEGSIVFGLTKGASVLLRGEGSHAAPSYSISQIMKTSGGAGSSDPSGFLSTPNLIFIDGDFPLSPYTHPITGEKSVTVYFPVSIIPEQKNQGIKTKYKIEVRDGNTGQMLGTNESQFKSRVIAEILDWSNDTELLIKETEILGKQSIRNFPRNWSIFQLGQERILYERIQPFPGYSIDKEMNPPQIINHPNTLDFVLGWTAVQDASYYELKILREHEMPSNFLSPYVTSLLDELKYKLEWNNDENYVEFEVLISNQAPQLLSGIRRQFAGSKKASDEARVITAETETISVATLPGNYELEARVVAQSYDGRTSNWSDWTPFTSTYDVTPPPSPSYVFVKFYRNTDHRTIEWQGVDAQDLSHYEIQRSSNGEVWPLTSLMRSLSPSLSFNDPSFSSKYRVRSVDNTGNRSSWSYPDGEILENAREWFAYG